MILHNLGRNLDNFKQKIKKKNKNDNIYKNEAHEIRILTNLEYLQILQNIQINLPKNHILKFMMIS